MRKMRMTALLLALVMVISLTGCGSAEGNGAGAGTAYTGAEAGNEAVSGTRTFTDSVGRTVEIPAKPEKIAVSGTMAQIVLFALCPDRLVGIAEKWNACAEEYLDEKYLSLPVTGQLHGGKGELNLETLLGSGAQIVVDVGEPKGSIKEEMDSLQEQTGIPFVHITAHTWDIGDAYRKLGELLDMSDEAETLAAYCDRVCAQINELASKADKARLLYITGDKGLNVIAKDSYHSEVIDLLSDNLAVVDDPSSKGTGNEVDIEQILNWDPDVIILEPGSVYETIGSDPLMQSVTAVRTGAYYEVPKGPYNWMGFPPSVQRLLGMMWMAKLLYPGQAGYDLKAEVTEYYKLFYHCDLTDAQYDALVANSIGRQAGSREGE